MSVINLQGQDFPLGSSGFVRINVGKLPSGNRISIFVYVFRSKNIGPTILFSGGMHGDEINGVEIIRRSIQQGMFNNLLCGTVIAIPLINIFGFINFSRDVPDGKDVNRSFPGTLKGSLAARVARLLTVKILPLVDAGIDFHSGGEDHWNYPQIRYAPKDMMAKELAINTKFPILVEKPNLPNSFRKTAKEAKKVILIYEGGEALRMEPFVIDKGLDLIRNLLSHYKMIQDQTKIPAKVNIYHKSFWERAPEAGMLTHIRQAGQYVKRGEVLAILNDPFGIKEVLMYASRDGFILAHNNAPVVNLGDGIIHLGYEEERV